MHHHAFCVPGSTDSSESVRVATVFGFLILVFWFMNPRTMSRVSNRIFAANLVNAHELVPICGIVMVKAALCGSLSNPNKPAFTSFCQ